MVIPTSLLPETIAMSVAGLQRQIALTPGKRVLFLTKDMDLIKQQLYHGLNLQMKDINPEDLLDDINTDVMTPAWVCFDHDPAEIAKNAYAGLKHNGLRVFNENALIKGNFEVIVSGQRKGTGSSRETAAQCERWAGIRIVIAASFAPIHERNNINLGQLMGDYKMLEQLQEGAALPLTKFTDKYDVVTKIIIEKGGLFPFAKSLKNNEIQLTDSLISLIEKPGLYGLEFDGNRYDCGNKLGFIEANVNFGLKDKNISKNLRNLLRKI